MTNIGFHEIFGPYPFIMIIAAAAARSSPTSIMRRSRDGSRVIHRGTPQAVFSGVIVESWKL
jgi:hypothetical protein